MKKLLLTIAALAAITAAPSWAADMPLKAPVLQAPPPFSWSGFYFGAHGGYLWGHTRVEENGIVTERDARTNGAVAGLLAGINWQMGATVVGFEADAGWTRARGNGDVGCDGPCPIVTVIELPNHYKINWTGHFRGRLGYASGDWLLFLAGGLAVADFRFEQGATITIINFPINPANVVAGQVFTGGSIGVGIERAFTPNLLGRIEYLHDEFGRKTYVIGSDSYTVRLSSDTVRGALAWKL
jgi:outer membrane immunogenic protein